MTTSLRSLVLGVAVGWLLIPATALASQAATLSARFEPYKLGTSTTITMGFTIHAPVGQLPSALRELELRLPAGVTGVFNTLGLATCAPATLREEGPSKCSPNSRIGRGRATIAAAIGAGILYEPVGVEVFMGTPIDGHTAMTFYVAGSSPIISQLVFPGLLLGDSGPFGARLEAEIPTIPELPGAPDVVLVGLQASIGPTGLTYFKHVNGRTVTFAPEGFTVPSRCPKDGFPFAAAFTFSDGAVDSVETMVPCPASHHVGSRRHG